MNNASLAWAPRPPSEEILDRLEEYFPEHNVDEPVVNVPYRNILPTTTTTEPGLPLATKRPSRHEKSARVAARERDSLKRSTRENPTFQQQPSAGDGLSGSRKSVFRWIRGELIAKGAYTGSKVYLALNMTTGEMLAVKQVGNLRTASDRSDLWRASAIEALKFESEISKDFDHPNIVQYRGFEESPMYLSIFQEYVPGGSIGSCLRKHGKFNDEVTKSFTSQILKGLEYLHLKGIVHRDIKANSILVEPTGICKISSFSFSKRIDDADVTDGYESMQSTLLWKAPEVIDLGTMGYNSKIDIWSVGCVVLEMWAGQRSWNREELEALMLRSQVPPVPHEIILSPLADDFRNKCFAINPDERPTANELWNHGYLELHPDWQFTGFE